MSETKTRYFGVVVLEDGDFELTKPRATKQGALNLARKFDGVNFLAVAATTVGEARELAAQRLNGGGGGDPWFAVSFEPGDVEAGYPFVALVSEDGWPSEEAARAVADLLAGEAPEGSHQAVLQGEDRKAVQRAAEDMAERGDLPTGKPKRTRVTNLGTGEPVVAPTYYVGKSGTVHADPECSFVRRHGATEFSPEDPAEPVVANVMAGQEYELADGRKFKGGWCQFCALTRDGSDEPVQETAAA